MPLSDPAVGRLPLCEAIASETVRRGERYISSVTISGRVVQPPAQLPAVVRGQGALIAILAVPPEAAQALRFRQP